MIQLDINLGYYSREFGHTAFYHGDLYLTVSNLEQLGFHRDMKLDQLRGDDGYLFCHILVTKTSPFFLKYISILHPSIVYMTHFVTLIMIVLKGVYNYDLLSFFFFFSFLIIRIKMCFEVICIVTYDMLLLRIGFVNLNIIRMVTYKCICRSKHKLIYYDYH